MTNKKTLIDMVMTFTDHSNRSLKEPWSDDKFTYATNGFVVVRVNRIYEYGIVYGDALPQIDELYWPIFGLQNNEKIKFEFEKINDTCTNCAGTGKLASCCECDGSGIVNFENDYSDYEVECDSCYGNGVSGAECIICRGTQKHISGTQRVGIHLMSNSVLNLISPLPNVSFIKIKRPLDPFPFQFDGGCGFAMPMNPGNH